VGTALPGPRFKSVKLQAVPEALPGPQEDELARTSAGLLKLAMIPKVNPTIGMATKIATTMIINSPSTGDIPLRFILPTRDLVP
jgi:hypothetical protein